MITPIRGPGAVVPLEHLEIAIGVAKRHSGAAPDHLLDGDGLSGLVIDEVNLGETLAA